MNKNNFCKVENIVSSLSCETYTLCQRMHFRHRMKLPTKHFKL